MIPELDFSVPLHRLSMTFHLPLTTLVPLVASETELKLTFLIALDVSKMHLKTQSYEMDHRDSHAIVQVKTSALDVFRV